MFAPTRDQARQFLFEAWRKYNAGEPLSALEKIALDVLVRHPEYHAMLDAPERYSDRDYGPESGQMNPFLHINLHLAVEEQLSIDQPPGIRAEYERLRALRGNEHDAQHDLLECLGEVLWQSQRNGVALDATRYLDCLRQKR
jgi:hypothetical protein